MLSLEQQNRWREQYRALNPGWQPATERYAALVREGFRPGQRLLDLGCGRGGLVEQLGPVDGEVVGVDPDWHSLREHRRPIPRAVGRGGRLPLTAATFDLVVASWVLEHMPDPQADLADVRRVLRPGGRFIFLTPNARHPLIAGNRLLARSGRGQRWLVDRLYGRSGADTFPAYYRANSAVRLRRLAAAADLQVTQLTAVADPTYLAFNAPLFRLLVRAEAFVPANRRLHLVGVMAAPPA